MQHTSLDETANVSWVDAVVTKGFAPEEMHTQQIPGWDIRDYSTALEPFTLKEENIELKQWGLDVSQKLTDGVRDLPGIVFHRFIYPGATHHNSLLGHVDTYIKNFFFNARHEYFDSHNRFIVWDDTTETGNVFKVEAVDGDGMGAFKVGDYVCIDFAVMRDHDSSMSLPPGWDMTSRWYQYMFKKWDISTGKSTGGRLPVGDDLTIAYVKLTHFDHIGRRRMRLTNGGGGGGNNGAVAGQDERLSALGDWNGLVYQSMNGMADWQNPSALHPPHPVTQEDTVWMLDPTANPDHRLDSASIIAPTGSNNSNVVSPNRTCARWITAGTEVTCLFNASTLYVAFEYVTAYDCKAHDAGTMPDLVGGGHAFNPWWATSQTSHKALTLKLVGELDISSRYFDGAGAASTFKDVIKTAPWDDFTIKFNTGTDPSGPSGYYNRNWLRVGDRHGRRYPIGHYLPGGRQITDTTCLFTDSGAPSGTFLQANDKGPNHLGDWSVVGGSQERYNNGVQLYQFTETTPPGTYNFANAANSRERSDNSDSILPTQYLAIAVSDHKAAVEDASYSFAQYPEPFGVGTTFTCTMGDAPLQVNATYTVADCLCVEMTVTEAGQYPRLDAYHWNQLNSRWQPIIGAYSHWGSAWKKNITHFLYKLEDADKNVVERPPANATFTVDPLEHKEHTLAPMIGPGNDPRADPLNLSLARYVREIQLVEYTVPALAGCVIVTLESNGNCLCSNPQCDFLIHNLNLSGASIAGEPFAVLQVMGGKLARDYNSVTGEYSYAYRPAYTQSETRGTITQGGDTPVIQDVDTVTRAREEDEVVHRIAPEGAPFARVVLGVTSNMSRFSACNAMGLPLTELTAYVYERHYNTVHNTYDVRACPHAQLRFRLLIDHGS